MKQPRALKRIDRKIYIVFFVVIAIAIINAVISTYTINQSQSITSELVHTTNPSLITLSRLNLTVTRSKMLATNWVFLPNNRADKDSLRVLNNATYPELRGRMKGLMRQWTDTMHSARVNDVFLQYEQLMAYHQQITRLLVDFEDYQDPVKRFAAEEILEREILPRSERVTEDLRVIISGRSAIAAEQQDRMLYSFNNLMVLVLGIALLIIGSIFIAGIVINRSIIVPVLNVRSVIMQMGRGELPELKMRFPKNAVGEMMQALRFMVDGFRRTSTFVEEIGRGNFNHSFQPLSENDVQGHALLRMRNQLKVAADVEAGRAWLSEGLAELNGVMRSNRDDFNELLDKIVDTIVGRTGAQQAAIFLLHNDDLNDLHIQLGAYFALNNKILNSRRYELKEGLVGQAIASNKVISLKDVYDPYFTIDAGLGESSRCNIIILPLSTSGKVVGAIEVASIREFTAIEQEMLEKMTEPIAASLFNLRANLITSQLLDESRKQAEELAYQEQELRKINDELTKQSQLLQKSEEELKAQQEELKQVNNELQDKAHLLEQQNVEIEDARQRLVFKAEQLEQSNRYKSAFLANMSHELRTPLNSILILAKLLSDNKKHNLDYKQVEHAHIIHKSGTDLLSLINDILDLSKIEAGKVELQQDTFALKTIADDMFLLFREFANDKKIAFAISMADAQLNLTTDKLRLEQVIKNLLSNAFKFTPENGRVVMSIDHAPRDIVFSERRLLQANEVVGITVQDSGIGIAPENQKQVFEAFQQADGSTSRKFGGTGLGLAICRELVTLMGGEVMLQSEVGKGSKFTVYLPLQGKTQESVVHEQTPAGTIAEDRLAGAYLENEIRDDRHQLQSSDKRILIIEDDYVFARMLMNQCHRFGYKAVIALQGDQGMSYAREYHPSAIILDLRLPVVDGWTILKQIKTDATLKHIPVHIISSIDKRQLGLELGASSYINKPAGRQEMDDLFGNLQAADGTRKILLLGPDDPEVRKVLSWLKEKEKALEIISAWTLEECEQLAARHHYAGFILGKHPNDAEWLHKVRTSNSLKNIPTLVLENGDDHFYEELHQLLYPDPGKEKVLADTETFLARVEKKQSNRKDIDQKMESVLKGKTVLLVDDDMRNIYSLTSILEQEGLNVICAYDGVEALEKLNESGPFDLVLMDIMMPNMNGIEAIQHIRRKPEWKHLPVIAVTAKAMSGDRERCMEAGASDYLTKPVNVDQLISIIKVWMYK